MIFKNGEGKGTEMEVKYLHLTQSVKYGHQETEINHICIMPYPEQLL